MVTSEKQTIHSRNGLTNVPNVAIGNGSTALPDVTVSRSEMITLLRPADVGAGALLLQIVLVHVHCLRGELFDQLVLLDVLEVVLVDVARIVLHYRVINGLSERECSNKQSVSPSLVNTYLD